MTLTATIAALRTVIDTVPGLNVYTDPPESINQFPSAIVYSSNGQLQFGSAGLARNYHTLIVEVYLSAQRLPQAVDAAKAYPDLIGAAITTALTPPVVFDVVDDSGRAAISYMTRPLVYNNITHFGVRFTIRLKEVVTS